MADNVIANPGAGGETFATDDIGGVQHPLTKLEWGPADTANMVDDVLGKRLPVKVAESVLPTGAATEGTLSTLNGKVTTVDTSNVTVGSSALPTGAATAARQDTGNTSLASIDTKIPASPSTDRTTAAGPFATRLSDGAAFYKATTPSDTQPVSIAATVNVDVTDKAARDLGKVDVASLDQYPPGQATMAASLPVAIASNQSSVPITFSLAATPTLSRVSVFVGNNVLLASNANRKVGTFIRNETDGPCYLNFGAAADDVTNYIHRVPPRGAFIFDDALYTGEVDGYWPRLTRGVAVAVEYA